MLFGGEAMFGVLDLGDNSVAGKIRAERIIGRATDLGARARFAVSGNVYLGMVRRAMDGHEGLSADNNDSINAVVSGEIYDRRSKGELYWRDPVRRRFLADGYRSSGMGFLGSLDGTFAAAVWERSAEQLVLLCDWRADARLYFSVADGLLVFSSWLQLLVGPESGIDRRAVEEFLRFLYIAPPRTIYDGVSCLEAGQCLTASRKGIEFQAISRDPLDASKKDLSEDCRQTLNRFEEVFKDAVRRRFGERRVGIFLSSGVDSATLTAVSQNVNPGQVETFTVGFEDVSLDESTSARAMADHVGVPHTELKFELSEYRRAFELLTRGFDQPFADPAGLPLILACESAKERVDVISGGVGGDDLFGTQIPRHLWFSTKVSAKLARFIRNGIAATLNRLPVAKAPSYATLFDFDDPEELFITWSGWSRKDLEQLTGNTVDLGESGFYRAYRRNKTRGAQDLFDALSFFPPDDCRFEAAALVYVPVQFPYHDADLNAYVRNLPERYRYSDCQSKILLRQLFNRYFPNQLLANKKHYFNIPLQSFIANHDFALVRRFLSAECLTRHALVEPRRVARWIDRYLAGDQSLLFKIWSLLVMHGWLESRN